MNTITAHPLTAAYNLLTRMADAAGRAGDVGHQFIIHGVRRLTHRAIDNQRAASHTARALGEEITDAEALFEAQLRDHKSPGSIDAEEVILLRAALRRPGRHAAHLAKQLDIPEVLP